MAVEEEVGLVDRAAQRACTHAKARRSRSGSFFKNQSIRQVFVGASAWQEGETGLA